MEKKLKLQKTMVMIYIIMAVVAFTYSLCFMTAYEDLFGLMLKANARIAYFHDVFMHGFNQTMFWFTLFGAVSIAWFYIFGCRQYVPDTVALVIISVSLLIISGWCIYALIEIPRLEATYLSLDFSNLALEGVTSDYVVRTKTFTYGMVIFAANLIVNITTIFTLISSNRMYMKTIKKEIA